MTTCARCRDTGVVFVRVGGEWDRPSDVEMPCDCTLAALAAARARKRERAVQNGILPAARGQ